MGPPPCRSACVHDACAALTGCRKMKPGHEVRFLPFSVCSSQILNPVSAEGFSSASAGKFSKRLGAAEHVNVSPMFAFGSEIGQQDR